MEKVLQNLRVRLKFRIRQAMKIKNFVAREIQYFEIEIFSFNSYVYYLTRGFIVPTRAFNLLSRAFNLAARAFNLANRSFSLLTRGFEPVTCGFEFVTRELELETRGFELVTRELELVTRGFELVTRVILFHETTSLCNGFRKAVFKCFIKMYTFVFASPVCLCLQMKLQSILTTGCTGKNRPVAKNF